MSNHPLIVEKDGWLQPFAGKIVWRLEHFRAVYNQLTRKNSSLTNFADAHHHYGLHRCADGWVFREWAPNATAIYLAGTFNDWKEQAEYQLQQAENGDWEIRMPLNKLSHGDLYKLIIHWPGGAGERLPVYATRVVQDEETKIFSAQVWAPSSPYNWKHPQPVAEVRNPLIYEAHIGMATEEHKVGSFEEFRTRVLPRVAAGGYNCLQLMAIQEHPYYGSFGYHVSNFFAVSSRFGTPDELKALIDEAHSQGLYVIMDLVHSHAVKNEIEGLGRFDGTPYQYFHDGPRREHVAWDSLCFNYAKPEVLRFLLSNCRYWLEEYQFDGFRFDGVTSMIYLDHGLGTAFTRYDMYFDSNQDEDALVYLKLANTLIHEIKPGALCIAEEMSGMPGMAAPVEWGGLGFDFRLAMGIPDYWIKLTKDIPDENWDLAALFYELNSRRPEEKTISYAESHDQALVGDKTLIFRLIDKEMYWHMDKGSQNLVVDRGVALHKLIRLITLTTAGGGYLNFMGNEFGHPEWIDFPREGNNWSYQYARRQWSLATNPLLRYQHLDEWDSAIIHLVKTNGLFDDPYSHLLHQSDTDKVLAYKRKDLVFVFNFHATQSFTDYGIRTDAGKYICLLSSDDTRFGGTDRVDTSLLYFTQREGKQTSDNIDYLKIYIPARTTLVFHHRPTPKVR